MTRKRFTKLLMGEFGYSKRRAHGSISTVRYHEISYQEYYDILLNIRKAKREGSERIEDALRLAGPVDPYSPSSIANYMGRSVAAYMELGLDLSTSFYSQINDVATKYNSLGFVSLVPFA